MSVSGDNQSSRYLPLTSDTKLRGTKPQLLLCSPIPWVRNSGRALEDSLAPLHDAQGQLGRLSKGCQRLEQLGSWNPLEASSLMSSCLVGHEPKLGLRWDHQAECLHMATLSGLGHGSLGQPHFLLDARAPRASVGVWFTAKANAAWPFTT